MNPREYQYHSISSNSHVLTAFNKLQSPHLVGPRGWRMEPNQVPSWRLQIKSRPDNYGLKVSTLKCLVCIRNFRMVFKNNNHRSNYRQWSLKIIRNERFNSSSLWFYLISIFFHPAANKDALPSILLWPLFRINLPLKPLLKPLLVLLVRV